MHTPALVIPDDGRYLWDWFEDLSSSVHRVHDGVCHPIPPSEYLAWAELSGHIVYVDEYAILRAMDRVFCEVMNEEFKAFRARQEEAQKQKAGKNG